MAPKKLVPDVTTDQKSETNINTNNSGTDFGYRHKILWPNVAFMVVIHALALWGWYRFLTGKVLWKSFILAIIYAYIGAECVIAGAHRLFSHRSYEVHPFLKAMILWGFTGAGQNSMFTWVRDHRLHHRCSDKDGDPHNATRGFFFSHMGWLMCEKHPLVKTLGREIDMSDLKSDWMVMFQKKYYILIYIPTAILMIWSPWYFFGETLLNSFLVCFVARYVGLLHGTWLVNSITHLYGAKPYDKNIASGQCWYVSILTLGEGWHNYHHVFPWDYNGAEITQHLNFTGHVIRFWEKIGLAFNLKTVNSEIVKNRIIRTGDGSHDEYGCNSELMIADVYPGLLGKFQ